MPEEFDYVIVGGGTAGCVLASELERRRCGSIAVIESGSQPVGKRIHTPALYTKLFGSRWDHGLVTVAQSFLRGRKIPWPRGKMLGGCSGMNAMIYSRGSPYDDVAWPTEWQYSNLVAHYESIEKRFFGDRYTTDGTSHSTHQDQDELEIHPLSERFLLGAEQSGYEILSNFGVEAKQGACRFRRTQHLGRRQTTFSVFLRSTLVRIISNATVEKIILHDQKATGVSVLIGKQSYEIHARKAVVLTAGAIHSPMILQRSGIGAIDTLARAGIEAKVPNEKVGENLQDHLVFPIIYSDKNINSMVSFSDRRARIRYAHDRTGPLASNIAEVGGFACLPSAQPSKQTRPDVQWHFTPNHYWEYSTRPDPSNAWTIGVTLLHPQSRGRIQIAHDDAHTSIIDPAYLSHPDDLERTIQAIEQAKEIAEQPALAECNAGQIFPGAKWNSADRLETAIRAYSTTIYHPVGTCAIGKPAMSVVDSRLQVHGMANLFVADASVIPELPSANPQAVVMMIGSRMASILAEV